ncbi:MAG: hypothetical protein VYB30_01200 [Candidatus Thermoplasmatota archaeon]|nr:hypothetical protein [Candidatus Thermoplasmatota archaeon]
MRQLLESEPFSSVASSLNRAVSGLQAHQGPVMLLAAPSLIGALSIAPIEAAFLDLGLPYRRRFKLESPSEGSWIHILGPAQDTGPEYIPEPPRLSLGLALVDGLVSSSGDIRRGPLTTVAQAHAIAHSLAPEGLRVRRLRPWLISGNWLHSALDTTYDPVFTTLRDMLVEEGSARIATMPEVPSIELSNTPWIEELALEAVSSRWPDLDMEGRARALSHLMRPALSQSTPSTARMEELGWHRVIGPNWDSDLASEILRAARLWKKGSATLAAHSFVDSLLTTGRAPSFE